MAASGVVPLLMPNMDLTITEATVVKWLKQPGQAVRTGERFGIIRFGSRVDVYLPEGVAPLVAPGQRAVAGETVIADMEASEPMRRGEMR